MRQPTGIVRNIDPLGRLVIPKEIRNVMDLPQGTPMEIFVGDDNSVILRKYAPGCAICGDLTGLVNYKGFRMCRMCVREMINALAG